MSLCGIRLFCSLLFSFCFSFYFSLFSWLCFAILLDYINTQIDRLASKRTQDFYVLFDSRLALNIGHCLSAMQTCRRQNAEIDLVTMSGVIAVQRNKKKKITACMQSRTFHEENKMTTATTKTKI